MRTIYRNSAYHWRASLHYPDDVNPVKKKVLHCHFNYVGAVLFYGFLYTLLFRLCFCSKFYSLIHLHYLQYETTKKTVPFRLHAYQVQYFISYFSFEDLIKLSQIAPFGVIQGAEVSHLLTQLKLVIVNIYPSC